MKTKKKELKVDYIGGQGPLTIAEEREISGYLAKKKETIRKSKKKSKVASG